MLRVLDEIPEKPIGHFTDVSTGEIIQITNEKGYEKILWWRYGWHVKKKNDDGKWIVPTADLH